MSVVSNSIVLFALILLFGQEVGDPESLVPQCTFLDPA